MTTDHQASRTLVKSPPELWAECSDAGSLARHLGEFGDIQITRLEPETIVAWEGERASGTVRIEPSGWGTKVTLTAHTGVEEPLAKEPEPVEPPARAAEEPDPVAEEPDPVAEEPDPVAEEPEPVAEEPEPVAEDQPAAVVQAELARPASGPLPPPRGGLWGRLFGRRRPAAPVVSSPVSSGTAPAPSPVAEPGPALEPEAQPEVATPSPEAVTPEPDPRPSLPEPEPVLEPDDSSAGPDAAAVLAAALDSLGQAHHRPFSRS
jgi:hypothetical protein